MSLNRVEDFFIADVGFDIAKDRPPVLETLVLKAGARVWQFATTLSNVG